MSDQNILLGSVSQGPQSGLSLQLSPEGLGLRPSAPPIYPTIIPDKFRLERSLRMT